MHNTMSDSNLEYGNNQGVRNGDDSGLGAILDDGSLVANDSGTEPVTKKTTYDVSLFFDDTEIVEAAKGSGEYATFDEAREAAIGYLEDVIGMCEDRLSEIRDNDTAEDYFGAEVVVAEEPEDDSNVQYICAGHYQPDPEVQGKSIEWFLGKVVKLRLPIAGRPNNGEYMWVAVESHRGDELIGTLTNEPHHADLHFGDEVVFGRGDVLLVHRYEREHG